MAFPSAYSILLLVTGWAFFPHSMAVEMTSLDKFNVDTLDKLIRRQLILFVINQINSTVSQQHDLQTVCEVKINRTIDICHKCVNAHSQVNIPVPQPQSIWCKVLPVLLVPVTVTSQFITSMESSVQQAASLLGDETANFVQCLGHVAGLAGATLLLGVHDIADGAGKTLEALGLSLANLANNLGHGLESAVNSLQHTPEHLGQFAQGLVDGVGVTLTAGANGALDLLKTVGQSLGNGISSAGTLIHTVGDGLSGVVQGLGGAISNLFGKRSPLTSSVCPQCDAVDVSQRTAPEIIADVCGRDNVREQRETEAFIQKMKLIYDSCIRGPIVNKIETKCIDQIYKIKAFNGTREKRIDKIEYDPSSVHVVNGAVSFNAVRMTFTLGNQTQTFSPLGSLFLTDLQTTANAFAEEIYSL